MSRSVIPSDLAPLIEAYGITFANTIGVIFICFTISVFIFGLLSFQVHHYYIKHTTARLAVKTLVALVWLFDCGQSIFQVHGLFDVLITNFGNIFSAMNPIWTINTSLVWGAFVYALVQSFFAYRIKVLSRSYIIPTVCWSVIVVRFVLTVWGAITSVTMSMFDFETKRIYLAHGGNITGVIVDNLLTGSLVYFLYKRSRGAMESTQNVAYGWIIFSIETGIITSLIGIILTITCWTMPYNGIWVGILFFHSKIYAVSLMLSLNREIPQENLHYTPSANVYSSFTSSRSRNPPPPSKIPPYSRGVVITLNAGRHEHSELETGVVGDSWPTKSLTRATHPVGDIEERICANQSRDQSVEEPEPRYNIDHPFSHSASSVLREPVSSAL